MSARCPLGNMLSVGLFPVGSGLACLYVVNEKLNHPCGKRFRKKNPQQPSHFIYFEPNQLYFIILMVFFSERLFL